MKLTEISIVFRGREAYSVGKEAGAGGQYVLHISLDDEHERHEQCISTLHEQCLVNSLNAVTNTTVNTACSQDDYISGGIKNNDYRF